LREFGPGRIFRRGVEGSDADVATKEAVERMMKKVSSADMARKFSEFCDMALSEPIIVTKNGRDRLVLLAVDEFNQLKEFAASKGAAEKRRSGDARLGFAHADEGAEG